MTERKAFKEQFGRLVRSYREKHGLTQMDVARLVYRDETKTSRVSDVERGRHDPQAATITDFREALSIPQEEINAIREYEFGKSKQFDGYINMLELLYTEQISKFTIWMQIYRWDHNAEYLGDETSSLTIEEIKRGVKESAAFTKSEFANVEKRLDELATLLSDLKALLPMTNDAESVKSAIRELNQVIFHAQSFEYPRSREKFFKYLAKHYADFLRAMQCVFGSAPLAKGVAESWNSDLQRKIDMTWDIDKFP